MTKRDEFPRSVIRHVSQRVGLKCSNPGCGVPTHGPDSGKDKSVHVGKASHITGAAKGGPRYDEALSTPQRKLADNAIWLCATCATKVDNDMGKAYPEGMLRAWKKAAEEKADIEVGTRQIVRVTSPGARVILCMTVWDKIPPTNQYVKTHFEYVPSPSNPPGDEVAAYAHHTGKPLPVGVRKLSIVLQNTGTATAEHVKFHIAFPDGSGAIKTVELPKKQGRLVGHPDVEDPPTPVRNRLQVIGGGQFKSSFVTLYVPELSAKQAMDCEILCSRNCEFTAEVDCANPHAVKKVLRYDVEVTVTKYVPPPRKRRSWGAGH